MSETVRIKASWGQLLVNQKLNRIFKLEAAEDQELYLLSVFVVLFPSLTAQMVEVR